MYTNHQPPTHPNPNPTSYPPNKLSRQSDYNVVASKIIGKIIHLGTCIHTYKYMKKYNTRMNSVTTTTNKPVCILKVHTFKCTACWPGRAKPQKNKPPKTCLDSYFLNLFHNEQILPNRSLLNSTTDWQTQLSTDRHRQLPSCRCRGGLSWAELRIELSCAYSRVLELERSWQEQQ